MKYLNFLRNIFFAHYRKI